MKKNKNRKFIGKNPETIFDQIHQSIKEKGGFEKVGLFDEEDIALMIRAQRNVKSNKSGS